MIFNYTIYGSITNEDDSSLSSDVYLDSTYYDNTLSTFVTKSYIVLSTESNYQINLGDRDMLGIQGKITDKDLVLIEVYGDEEKTNKIYSDYILLNYADNILENNIILGYTENNDEANLDVHENLIKVAVQNIEEKSENLFNYYEVKNEDTNEVIRTSNESFDFVPTKSGSYGIYQTALNKNGTLSTNSYVYNAIVSSTNITRSTKCKSINDTIKIMILGVSDDETPDIIVYRDDEEITSGTMADEGKNLFSWNYTFSEEGYYCFRVSLGSEVFIIDYKVNQSALKFYFSEESLEENLSLSFDYYYINDTGTLLGTHDLVSISKGLYGSPLLDISYGDYLIIINDEEYVVSFEECVIIQDEGTGTAGSSNTEEIYWIFPDMIGN